eukprot:486137_1
MNGVRPMRRDGGLCGGRGARGKFQPNNEKRDGKGNCKYNGYCGENVMDEVPVDVPAMPQKAPATPQQAPGTVGMATIVVVASTTSKVTTVVMVATAVDITEAHFSQQFCRPSRHR